ncbi:MAG: adenylate/guanylate cyclase domain-containing protein [Spirochaetaceae bacterium]|nr:adenylate/guanylate cyclase domain-containing protein [Spirochaetaceae bacterium]
MKKHGGDIDKFVGDEIMALFKDPVSAISAAVEIQSEMKKIKQNIHNLTIGISVHIGEVVSGDVGSLEHKDYTVIGDTVNTAARLQAVALGGEIIVSEAVKDFPKIQERFILEYKDNLLLKGKSKQIKTYKVLSSR